MTSAVLDLFGALFLLLGAVLSLGAAVGILRFHDVVTRMHAGAKPQTLGLLFIVVGASLSIREAGVISLAVLIIAFQFLTIPVSTHMVARTAYRTGLVPKDTLVTDELAEELADVASGPRAKPRVTTDKVKPRPKVIDEDRRDDLTGDAGSKPAVEPVSESGEPTL